MSFAHYKAAMDLVARACIDNAADSLVKRVSLNRSLQAAGTLLVHGFREIESTLKALELVEVLIGTAAPRSTRLSKTEYLKFLVGSHLQEIYILEQRLMTYATRMARAYKGNIDLAAIQKMIHAAVGGIVELRGKHVHQERYTDHRLDFLQGVAYVEHVVDGLSFLAKREYRTVQGQWQKYAARNSTTIQALLDNYFECLLDGITKDAHLLLPRTGHGQVSHIPMKA